MCPKLTSLNELTSVDEDNDFLYIVDASESSSSLKGKKVKPKNALKNKVGTTSTLGIELVSTDNSLENTHNTAGHLNLVTHNGKQYIAYYNVNADIVLGERVLTASSKGAWTFNTLDASPGPQKNLPAFDDNHDNISLGFDENHFIHVAWGVHNNPLKYFKMPTANTIVGTQGANISMLGTNESVATYPHFFNRPSDGKLFFMFRDNLVNRRMYEYDAGTTTWTAATGTSTAGLFIQAPGTTQYDRAYMSYPYFKGDVASFACNWYDNTTPFGNDPFYLEYDTLNGTFEQGDKTTQTIPVVPSNEDLIKSISPDKVGLYTMGDRNLYVDPTTGKISIVVNYPDANGIHQLNLHTHSGASGGSWDAGTQLTQRATATQQRGYNPLLVDPNTGVWYLLYWYDTESFNMMCIESTDAGTTWSNPYPVLAPRWRRGEVSIDFPFWDANAELYMPYEGSFDVDQGDAGFEHIIHKKRNLYLEHWIPSEGKTWGITINNQILSYDDVNIRSIDGHVNIGKETRLSGDTDIIDGHNGASTTLRISRFHDDPSSAANFHFRRANGAEGSESVITNGDRLGAIFAYGHDGTDYILGAAINFVSDGDPGTNDMPGRIEFRTTADGASGTTLRLSLTSEGALEIPEISTPSNPAADTGSLYVADDTGTTKLYFRDSAGTETDLLTGSGDVTKVGTPANDQVGVWTGDGTIEGGSALNFDGSTLEVNTGIHVLSDSTNPDIRLVRFFASNQGSIIDVGHSRGNESTPVIVNDNDVVGLIRFRGGDGTGSDLVTDMLTGAQITAEVTGTPSTTSMPMTLNLATTPAASTIPVTRLSIDPDGRLSQTVFTDATRGTASNYAAGTMIWNSDDAAPNWSDGTNWKDAAGVTT